MDINTQTPLKVNNSQLNVSSDLIYYFALLGIIQNIGVTANTLDITHQGLIRAIESLENTLKLKLFNRENGFNGLTQDGEIIFEKSQKNLENLKELNNKLLILNPEKNELINIIWEHDYYRNILPDAIAEIMNKKSNVFFKVHFISKSKMIEQLISFGFIDFGMMFKKPSLNNLDFIEGKKIPYIIAGKTKTEKEWHELEYISMPVNNNGELLSHNNKYPRCRVNTEISEFDPEFCESNMFVTYVLESQIKEQIDQGLFSKVAEPPEKNYIIPYLVFNKNITMTDSVKELIEKIKVSFI